MGFYIRKSVRVGLFRFNLSQQGVGVSVGLKGLRIGTGPRGNYVHMGRGGLYYRATVPRTNDKPPFLPHVETTVIPEGTHAPLVEIESADASQIVDSSSRDLLDEMNAKQARWRLWPWVGVLGILVVFLGLRNGWSIGTMWGALILGSVLTIASAVRDTMAKTVVLFYDFDAEMEEAYEALHSSGQQVSAADAAWHIEAEGAVHDRKYHAGASNLVRRKKTTIARSSPPYVKTNIETISRVVGRQTLHFFPDRVLIFDEKSVGAVSYRELQLQVNAKRFIESASLPRDATVVDRTWQFVNKKGGPDRRFKNNRELPVCLYDELKLSSTTGLNEVVQISRNGVGEAFAKAILDLARVMPSERVS